MVGLVVATHGKLGDELLATVGSVCGPLERARAVSISSAQPMEEARESLAAAIRDMDDGDGVLVVTDMFGGTPANLALTFLDARIEVVTGVNLPMLLKLSTARAGGATLAATAEMLAGYGQKNITLVSQLLRDRVQKGR
ncbi:MAG: PTS fructose transporter subunit IIA [Deltaproteobacteria bacterium]|nr:PTS fructose transporter subunit IIA [Deltaproteobacteria bacterium]